MSFGGLSFEQIINGLLYFVSGYFFAIFSSRHSLACLARIRQIYAEKGLSLALFMAVPLSILFILFAFLIFPSWLTTRTYVGAFTYYAVLLYFFSKGVRNARAAEKQEKEDSMPRAERRRLKREEKKKSADKAQ